MQVPPEWVWETPSELGGLTSKRMLLSADLTQGYSASTDFEMPHKDSGAMAALVECTDMHHLSKPFH